MSRMKDMWLQTERSRQEYNNTLADMHYNYMKELEALEQRNAELQMLYRQQVIHEDKEIYFD